MSPSMDLDCTQELVKILLPILDVSPLDGQMAHMQEIGGRPERPVGEVLYPDK